MGKGKSYYSGLIFFKLIVHVAYHLEISRLLGVEIDYVNMMFDGQTLHFQIIDEGIAFDPTAKQKTDTTLSVEERQIGGLGILLVRELMDSINYERTGGRNILTLIKKFK